MARSRNIKPSFFTNDELAESNCPLGRLLFAGLWCQADYKGDVEWRPSRLKIYILPYDDCDIKELAINLDKSGFISFYSDGKKIYLHIDAFEKHQNPHPNEKKKGSEIPAFSESLRQFVDISTLTINHDKSRQESDDSQSDQADSFIPHPDSLQSDSLSDGASANADTPPKKLPNDYPDEFEAIWQAYPKREGNNPKNKAYSAYKARLAEGVKPEVMAAGVARYAEFTSAKGSTGTEFVMQGQRFFGKERAFENDWTVAEVSHEQRQRSASGGAGQLSTVGRASANAERRRQELRARMQSGDGGRDDHALGEDGPAVRGQVAPPVRGHG